MSAKWRDREALEDHYDDHKHEFGSVTIDEYEASALETITTGESFTYTHRMTRRQHLGYYDRATGRFTGVSGNGRRIYTHFKPSDGEDYVRRLLHSTYPY
jgi:pyocin large subunit-like protein